MNNIKNIILTALMFLVSSCATDIVDLMGGINGVVKDANDGHVISNC